MKNKNFIINEEDKKLFEDVFFLVEATDAERFFLWKENDESKRVSWEDIMRGYSIQIGTLDKRPVMVTIFYAMLNGKKIMFYEGTSQVVDHKMIELWIQHFSLNNIRWDNGTRWAHCNAMNFHHCLEAIKESI